MSESEDLQENIREQLAVSDMEPTSGRSGSRDSITWASPSVSRRKTSRLMHMASVFEDDVRTG